MNKKINFAIVGTGAVGGYYGGLLHKHGYGAHFLVNSDYGHVSKYGLQIDSKNGDFHIPIIQAYNNPHHMPRCDVVIIALKTTANAALSTILPPLMKDNTIVLTLQNGLGSDEEIASLVGDERVIGGLCFLCSNRLGPGHIQHLDYGLITLGEYHAQGLPAGCTERLRVLGDQMSAAGISIRLEDDLAQARWKKLVWNIPFNGLSVVRNVLTNELVKNTSDRKLCETLMHEVAAASVACSRPIDPLFVKKMLTDTEKMKPYAPSMKLDFDRGKPMELDAIYRIPLERARAAGVSMPETKKLYDQLCQINPPA